MVVDYESSVADGVAPPSPCDHGDGVSRIAGRVRQVTPYDTDADNEDVHGHALPSEAYA